ncbi:MAG TPA: hypothetical protein VFY79_07750 [Dehalococcoidia bacterium]|nr:hypothetical protein [Dehalococcoidia bacterium]
MLEKVYSGIRDDIAAGRLTNEVEVAYNVVLPLLHALSWPASGQPDIVSLEYSTGEQKVDYTLCNPPKKPIVFIEVRRSASNRGYSNEVEHQFLERAVRRGVPMAILTDGQEWHFYLPAEQGDDDERQLYKLEILEREPEESIERLKRYLDYGAICSGTAIEAARQDYYNVAKERQIQKTLPEAWRKLIEEKDDLLVDLLAEKVESLCGYKPTQKAVSDFLVRRVQLGNASPQPAKMLPKPVVSRAPTTSTSPPTLTSIGFILYGQVYPARSGRDVMVKVLQQFIERDPSFLECFLTRLKKGRSRPYIAHSPKELYPKSPHLADTPHNYRRLCPGWFIDVNRNTGDKEKMIREAAEIAGVRFGSDLVINLGN